jgi:hypothetical protein
MLRLNILPTGYIYPKEERPIRDLLRKRSHLVRLRTSLLISLQNVISRNCGIKIKADDIKCLSDNRIHPLLSNNVDLALAGQVSKDSIDFLTRQIRAIESFIEKRLKLKDAYKNLLTLPGIGKILSLTIMLETGPIERFGKVGNYASYCRAVSSKWISNGKAKGKGNKKNGNKYLSWAFSEAAELARRFDEDARAYYNRKLQKTNFMIAHSALAHKLARAAYYIMKDNVAFIDEIHNLLMHNSLCPRKGIIKDVVKSGVYTPATIDHLTSPFQIFLFSFSCPILRRFVCNISDVADLVGYFDLLRLVRGITCVFNLKPLSFLLFKFFVVRDFLHDFINLNSEYLFQILKFSFGILDRVVEDRRD